MNLLACFEYSCPNDIKPKQKKFILKKEAIDRKFSFTKRASDLQLDILTLVNISSLLKLHHKYKPSLQLFCLSDPIKDLQSLMSRESELDHISKSFKETIKLENALLKTFFYQISI
ncbi:hypothetical protein BpHYR1_004699 [Brachionus plicatilis]|uniref:Uncharacterized protein n=1 Tax=Brachionus plicatilis TaxID=10195 RepID=A0A3M7SK54_BRAPC|nr:hypothetical protein BpHYR1_004699 [Brachionus plicatilis]